MIKTRALVLAAVAAVLAGALYIDWQGTDDDSVRPVRAANTAANAALGGTQVSGQRQAVVAPSIVVSATARPASGGPQPVGPMPLGPPLDIPPTVTPGGPPGSEQGPQSGPSSGPNAGPNSGNNSGPNSVQSPQGPPGSAPGGPAGSAMPPSGPATANVLGGVSEFHPLYQLSPIDLTATVRRPLFEPSRQPTGGAAPPLPQTVATPSAPAAVEADAAGYRLVGVIVSDERTTALLTVPGSTATLRLEAGDTLEGWKVAAIKLSHVTLERQGRRVELKMLRQAK